MHEWALAETIFKEIIKEQKEKQLKKISCLDIIIGELEQDEKRAFNFALREVIRLKKIKIKKIRYLSEKALLKCKNCETEWRLGKTLKKLNQSTKEIIHFMPSAIRFYAKCPKCKKQKFKIIKGDKIKLKSIK